MKNWHLLLGSCLVWCSLSLAYSSEAPRKASFMSGNKPVSYEVFEEASNGPIVILLHGASGPDVPLYRQQAQYFSTKGYTVLLLHFFDATGSSIPSGQNYNAWVDAVTGLVHECRTNPAWATQKIALLGYSLGASVALAAGSQGVPVDAIADWYGSLPDEFFYRLKSMPPLLILHGKQDSNIPILNAQQLIRLCEIRHFNCENHIYPDQNHGFTGKALEDAEDRTTDFFSRMLK
ncbi:MAG TPA: dienelactone hydrolase family protein [Silvibacterium sp.]|jgi:dienelactone hydrolase|nr:dienelactone hydrolase family protein [Silvibacterium sp.]